jgi:16S rRNA (cytosine967-C5)-methyltransferase
MTSARDYALAQLDRLSLPGWRTKLIRRPIVAPPDLRDLGLAEQIRVGVIKNLALLEFLTNALSKHPGRIDPLIRKIVTIGLYQLRFLTRMPVSAVVDETVEQTRRFGRQHSAGFVNALLRTAALTPDVKLPDARDNPQQYAQIVLSHPPELVQRLFKLLGTEQALEFCAHDNREPPTIVRLFKGVTAEQLTADGVTITPHAKPGMVVVGGARRPTFADWAARGLAQVQDPTSAQVVGNLDLQPKQNVLDRCAGLGTKTFQIHEQLGDDGWIMAVEPSEARCRAMRELIATRQLENIAVVQASMLHEVPDIKQPAFDRILIDAPCSNSGVLARRPEARYSQTTHAIASLTKLQDEILRDTADYLRPGGLMIYSTCSVWQEENEDRAQHFIGLHPNFQMLHSQLTLPSLNKTEGANYHDGGYLALLRRAR